MTRPSTLAEAARRIVGGTSPAIAIPEFVDAFNYAASARERLNMLMDEPPFTGDARHDALFGAIGEYLAKQNRLGHVPAWVSGPGRILDEPWFTTSLDSPAMREYLVHSSPAEFIHHQIFTEAMPLRRASDQVRDRGRIT